MPDLVVEVISPNDLAIGVSAKIHDFLNAGVPLIWVADPDTRAVTVYRGDGTAAFLTGDDEIDGGGVLRGFRCKIADFFDL